jgi:hypothetical protein
MVIVVTRPRQVHNFNYESFTVQTVNTLFKYYPYNVTGDPLSVNDCYLVGKFKIPTSFLNQNEESVINWCCSKLNTKPNAQI